MSTRTSELIEETLREWDDYAAIEDEERFECVTAAVERKRNGKAHANAVQRQASSIRPGYTISSAWDKAESRRH